MTYQSVASFETGHIYGTDRPFPILKPGQPETVDFDNVQDPVFDLEMQLGLRIQKYLESNFSEVKRLWFHDDVAPRMKQKISVDSSRWEHFIQVPPEQVKQILELQ